MHELTLPPADHYDEMLFATGALRPHYQAFSEWLHKQSPEALSKKRTEADLLFHRVGITFAVYGDEAGAERLIPFDTVPRIVPADEWKMLEVGLRQRVSALNKFLWDIYHDHNIIKAGLIPAEQVFDNAQYQPVMQGLDLPHGIYTHITGVDLIRHSDGSYYVLEDNLRVPSGVSYMLENRKMMMRLFPE
ncbi:circularly permuted type 2 ATP-grasp protein, partial [Roseateles sp. GG27B]